MRVRRRPALGAARRQRRRVTSVPGSPGAAPALPAQGASWRRRTSAPARCGHGRLPGTTAPSRQCARQPRRRKRLTGQGRGRGAMAGRGAASSEHLERLHEIFRGLHVDLRGVPERLRGSAAGEAGRGSARSSGHGRGRDPRGRGSPPAAGLWRERSGASRQTGAFEQRGGQRPFRTLCGGLCGSRGWGRRFW